MPEISTTGLSTSDVLTLIAQNATTSFVGGTNTTPTTVNDLLTTYPPSAAYLGKYARVTDLFGSVDDIMRCRFDGSNYRWIPQRPNFNATMAATGGSMQILPLVTPPTFRLTGTLLGNLSITPSATNAYVGMQYRVIQNSTLGLFTTAITGLIGSNLTLAGNSTQILEYGPTGWFAAGNG